LWQKQLQNQGDRQCNKSNPRAPAIFPRYAYTFAVGLGKILEKEDVENEKSMAGNIFNVPGLGASSAKGHRGD